MVDFGGIGTRRSSFTRRQQQDLSDVVSRRWNNDDDCHTITTITTRKPNDKRRQYPRWGLTAGIGFYLILVLLSFSGLNTSFQVDAAAATTATSTGNGNGNGGTSTTSTTGYPTPSAYSDLRGYFPNNGPLDDASCNVEDLEQANDEQLFAILHELKNTSFFRSFVVDLDHKCPLQSWRNLKNEKTVNGHGEEKKKKEDPQQTRTADKQVKEKGGKEAEKAKEEAEEEEEEFECDGGKEELDEDAPPLCQVDGGGGGGAAAPGGDPFSSNALFSLSQEGFKSKEQQDTFAWSQQTDIVVVAQDGEPCEAEMLPDSFWVDLCSNIQAGDGSSVVNLAINPERNTGYNGTHIWKAIYEENCIFAENKLRVLDKDKELHESMCFEERVFYRLLSGLHTSTTLSIAMNYYPPSKRKGRENWEPNPEYFMEKFHDKPNHIRNLHFSYVVLLRALQKASKYLYDYDIRTGDIVEDETAKILLRRLLDSYILKTCSNVFSAFDESLMFQDESLQNVISLQKNFKGVFHNISTILDCVQCQQCKLHGKMAMTGYGTALKVLFMKEKPELTRNEIVAFINTIAKLSESIRHVRELTQMFWEQQQAKVAALGGACGPAGGSSSSSSALPIGSSSTTTTTASASSSSSPASTPTTIVVDTSATISIDVVDAAVGVIASLGEQGHIGWEREAELVDLALKRHADLLLLAKHYAKNPTKFLALTQGIGTTTAAAAGATATAVTTEPPPPDAIIVGSGLAGLAAALNILDRGGSVIIVEKEHLLGGNSNKASSGINAYIPGEADADSLEIFRNDTIKSAGASARPDLIDVLVSKSGDAVAWLRSRVGVDLSLKAQLGGHSTKRTHRPSTGMVGAEIIYGMQKAVRSYEKTGRVKILVDTRVTKLITTDDGTVVGVACVSTKNSAGDQVQELRAPNVILATGGFASDRSSGSYLEQNRPELLQFPTTAGPFSTGDGITLAKALGAGTVDMDKVQVHPTGWVDPADPDNTNKILAAELMRGVGGLLINRQGKRFCDELGNRAYVTKQMLNHDKGYAKTGKWDIQAPVPTFFLVLSSSAAANAKKHVDLYSHKGLLTKLTGVAELAKFMNLPKTTVVASLKEYQEAAEKGIDAFNKTTFDGVPSKSLDDEVFYAGIVTPVLHYCMGGITIDKEGYVLNEKGERIPGLHAAGEVTGGVHGGNRLAGNSLLECTVFGSIVGQKIPIQSKTQPPTTTEATAQKEAAAAAATSSDESTTTTSGDTQQRIISLTELRQHDTDDDCWVALHGVVYDLTYFAPEHPAGPTSIYELAGKDGTEAFSAVHHIKMLEDFDEEIVGVLEQQQRNNKAR